MVKEHPDDHQVASGTVRWEDNVGDDQADNAADLERRDQQAGVIATCRKLVSGREYWYSWVWLLHRFMNAISRAALMRVMVVVTLPALLEKRQVHTWYKMDLAMMPGSPGFWIRLGSIKLLERSLILTSPPGHKVFFSQLSWVLKNDSLAILRTGSPTFWCVLFGIMDPVGTLDWTQACAGECVKA